VFRFALSLLCASLVPLSGCATAASRSFTFDAADYPAAFDAARETVRDRRFELNRVDARAGVIATVLKPTAGLATPYDTEQLTLGQEWQDFINDQMREVRVWFRPVGTDVEGGPLDATGPIEATVEVTIFRRRYPGWQLETEHIAASGRWTDPDLARRTLTPGEPTPLRRDDRLAGDIAADIRAAIEHPTAPAE